MFRRAQHRPSPLGKYVQTVQLQPRELFRTIVEPNIMRQSPRMLAKHVQIMKGLPTHAHSPEESLNDGVDAYNIIKDVHRLNTRGIQRNAHTGLHRAQIDFNTLDAIHNTKAHILTALEDMKRSRMEAVPLDKFARTEKFAKLLEELEQGDKDSREIAAAYLSRDTPKSVKREIIEMLKAENVNHEIADMPLSTKHIDLNLEADTDSGSDAGSDADSDADGDTDNAAPDDTPSTEPDDADNAAPDDTPSTEPAEPDDAPGDPAPPYSGEDPIEGAGSDPHPIVKYMRDHDRFGQDLAKVDNVHDAYKTVGLGEPPSGTTDEETIRHYEAAAKERDKHLTQSPDMYAITQIARGQLDGKTIEDIRREVADICESLPVSYAHSVLEGLRRDVLGLDDIDRLLDQETDPLPRDGLMKLVIINDGEESEPDASTGVAPDASTGVAPDASTGVAHSDPTQSDADDAAPDDADNAAPDTSADAEPSDPEQTAEKLRAKLADVEARILQNREEAKELKQKRSTTKTKREENIISDTYKTLMHQRADLEADISELTNATPVFSGGNMPTRREAILEAYNKFLVANDGVNLASVMKPQSLLKYTDQEQKNMASRCLQVSPPKTVRNVDAYRAYLLTVAR